MPFLDLVPHGGLRGLACGAWHKTVQELLDGQVSTPTWDAAMGARAALLARSPHVPVTEQAWSEATGRWLVLGRCLHFDEDSSGPWEPAGEPLGSGGAAGVSSTRHHPRG
ncbi:hypothetical protein ABZ820_18720 [Streptomyces diacarni]|uniref:Uncharacterized protein n=1 Tax=Streptomyces diacarni TaxID=2800381 RepID=A0A367F751_9ACTN|nr:hypothetical protein [Streptomyces diacarni]RCG25507.1 hypothetical protein DTL70_08940 [Streptomyces diacarni]